MTPPTVVVTGASGFLGRALVARLAADGVVVRAVTRAAAPVPAAATCIRADIGDAGQLAEAFRGVDAVFHLAAHVHDVRSTDDTALQRTITLGGTLAVLDAAARTGVANVIFASSLAVFGATGSATVTEAAPCNPETPYGRAKLEAEAALVDFAVRTGAAAAAIRPAMMYGTPCPGNLTRMIGAVSAGWFPPIPEFGNRRSMVSVEDVAEVMLLAWRKPVLGGRPYIVTDGEAYSTRAIYDMIRDALGRSRPSLTIPRSLFTAAARAGDVGGRLLGRRLPFDSRALDRIAGSAHFDAGRARQELGFRPTMTLRDVMPSLVRQVTRG